MELLFHEAAEYNFVSNGSKIVATDDIPIICELKISDSEKGLRINTQTHTQALYAC